MTRFRGVVGATTLVALLVYSQAADAAGGDCRSVDLGCSRHHEVTGLEYRYPGNVNDLRGHSYIAGVPVANTFGAIRINSASYVRMCVYANPDYANPLYWVTTHNIWATTGQAGLSLRFRTSSSC